MKTTTKVLLCAASMIAFSSTAQAQMIGPCPSPASPAPCIIFDYKKLTDIATMVAQEKQKIQGAIDQITELKSAGESFGASLAGNIMIGSEAVMEPNNPDNYSLVPLGTVEKMSNDIARVVYAGGSDGVSSDKATVTDAARDKLAQGANTNAFSVANQSCRMAKQSIRKIKELEEATKKSKDFRGDWLANSQIKLETSRILAQKNYLFSTWLEQQASEAAHNADKTLTPTQTNSSYGPSAPAAAVDPAWAKNKLMEEIGNRIQELLNSASLAKSATQVLDMLKGQVTDHEASVTKKDAALAALRAAAVQWVRESGKGSADQIVNAVLSGLTNMDSQLAAIRARDISTLSREFELRNIDVAKMTSSDVDPRQFIGTWGDPLKTKLTLDMSNAMLKGSLDSMIEGDDDNDQFRNLVYAYNDARLEEAWKRQIADEAKPLIVETGDIVSEEDEGAGLKLTDDAAVTAEITRLVAEANALAQQVAQSPDEKAKAEAAAIVKLIQGYISGNVTATQEVTTAGTVEPIEAGTVSAGDGTGTGWTPEPTG